MTYRIVAGVHLSIDPALRLVEWRALTSQVCPGDLVLVAPDGSHAYKLRRVRRRKRRKA